MTRDEILNGLRSGALDVNEASKLLDALPKDNGGNSRQIKIKVSVKGAISVYVNTRMPTTLYADQWARVWEWDCPKGDDGKPLVKFADTEIGKFIAEWEGKEYKSETSDGKGKKIPYTARISHKSQE